MSRRQNPVSRVAMICLAACLLLPGGVWAQADSSITVHGFTVTGDVSSDDDGNTVISGSAEFKGVEVRFEDLTVSPGGKVLSLGGGGFTLAGLEIDISGGQTDGGELEVSASMALPDNLSGQAISTSFRLHDDVIEAIDVEVPGPAELGLIDLSDVEIDLDFEDDSFSGGGSFEVPDLFTLTASVGVAEGKLDSFDVDLMADPIVTLGEIVNLNEIGVSGENLARLPVTVTLPSFILPFLPPGFPNPITFIPPVTFSGTIGFDMINENTIAGSVTVTFDETGYFKVSGSMDLFTFDNIVSGELEYRPLQDFDFDLDVSHRWTAGPAYAEIDVGGGGTITGRSFRFSAHGSVKLHLVITISASGNVTVSHTSSGTNTISGSASVHTFLGKVSISFKVQNGHVSISHQEAYANYLASLSGVEPRLFEPGLGYYTPEVTMLTNYNLVFRAGYRGAPMLQLRSQNAETRQEATTFDLQAPAGDVALIRCAYTGTTAAQLMLETPTGAVFTPQNTPPLDPDGDVPTSPVLYNEAAQEGTTIFYVTMGTADTPSGTYTVTVLNPETIGNHTIEALVPNRPPTLTFEPLQSQTDPATGDTTYTVSWTSEDPDTPNADLTLHLAPNHNDNAGALIGGEHFDPADASMPIPADAILVNDTNTRSFSFSSRREDVASGEYFVLAILNDGRNAPVLVHSTDPVLIVNPNGAPKVPNVFAVNKGDGEALVTWDAVEGAAAYRVYYGRAADDEADDQVIVVFETHAIVPGLEAGVVYRFVVRAVAEGGAVQGLPSDAAIVLMQNLTSDGSTTTTQGTMDVNTTPPVIFSRPPRTIRVGDRYTYQILAMELNGQSLTYALLQGPDGMTMSDSGLLTWTPGAADLGFHEVTVQVTGASADHPAVQTFRLHVLGGSVMGIRPEIISTAPHTGVPASSKYTYQLIGHAISRILPDGTRATPRLIWKLLSAPDGASLSSAGLFRWRPHTSEEARTSHRVAVRLEDADGLYTSQTFVIPAFTDAESAAAGDDDDDDGPCFIAAVTSGTPMTKKLRVLRKFRDTYLLPHRLGKAFVDAYYWVSPMLTDIVTRNASLRGLARLGLIPVILGAHWLLGVPSLAPFLLFTLGLVPLLLLTCGLGLVVARARRRRRVTDTPRNSVATLLLAIWHLPAWLGCKRRWSPEA